MQASLSQLWGMLNSMQIVVHMPMLQGLKFPANSMTIVGQMIKLATFDLIPTEIIDAELYYWPEEDPFSINFEIYQVLVAVCVHLVKEVPVVDHHPK